MVENESESKTESQMGEQKLINPDLVAKGIAAGSFLAAVYFLDKLLAEEKYVKDENDQWVMVKKGIFDELFE
jgi:hypothetical protein